MKIVSIDNLDLVDFAADAARILLKAHPEVMFTSGRRTVDEQASAMAANVVKRRKWIEQTYVKSANAMHCRIGLIVTPKPEPKQLFLSACKAL